MLNGLIADTLEDIHVMEKIDHKPGQSLMESVYEAQKQVEAPQFAEPQQDLPGEDTINGQNNPGFDTINGQNYPGLDTVNLQTDLHQGRLGQVVQPFQQLQPQERRGHPHAFPPRTPSRCWKSPSRSSTILYFIIKALCVRYCLWNHYL